MAWMSTEAWKGGSFGFMSCGQDLHSDLEQGPSCDSWFHLKLGFA